MFYALVFGLSACGQECGGMKGPVCVDASPFVRLDDTGTDPHPFYSSAGGWTEVTTAWWHTCGVERGGAVRCWGADDNGETDVPDNGQSYHGLSAGWFDTCGISSGGFLCWGGSGGLGVFSGSPHALSAGAYTVCQREESGQVTCVALASPGGQHGQSDAPEGSFRDVSAGQIHTCAVDSASSVQCWGAGKGEGGEYDFGQSTPPVGTFVQVSAGDWHTCAVTTDSSVVCWGNDTAGQASPPAGEFVQVSAGHWHTCALDTAGAIHCWGNDDSGQCRPPTGTFTQVTSGGDHACALDTDGVVHCWGDNADGQVMPP